MSDRGTIAPLVASYLGLILLMFLGVSSVGLTLVAANRVQGVADYALLFAHDRSALAGIPSDAQLRVELEHFLASADSAKQLEITGLRHWVLGDTSHLELCARHRNLLGVGLRSVEVCRSAAARSYELPRGLSGA